MPIPKMILENVRLTTLTITVVHVGPGGWDRDTSSRVVVVTVTAYGCPHSRLCSVYTNSVGL